MHRLTFLQAVALAAGRIEKVQPEALPDEGQNSLVPPTREQAIEQGRLILVAEDNETNQIVIGYLGRGSGSNTTTIGNSNTTDTYLKGNVDVEDDLTIGARLVVSVEDVTCAADNTCAYNANVVTTRITSGSNAAPDTLIVPAGVDGQRRTFILVVHNAGDDVTIDVSAGTDTTLNAAGESVTYEYDDTTDKWWIIASHGL